LVKIKEWMQIFRAHTTPCTVLIVETFYLAGGGVFFSYYNLLLIIWATLLHWMGFGHNTLMDYARGFDKVDPHKQHFPLNRGVISENSAHLVLHYGMLGLAGLSGYIVLMSEGNKILSLIFILIYVQAGHAYNDGLNKANEFNFIPLTICYTALAVASYFLGGGTVNWVFWLITLYIVTQMVFQIGFEGELKEIEHPTEPNLLKRLGARFEGNYLRIGLKNDLVWTLVKAIHYGTGAYIGYGLSGLSLSYAIGFFLLVAAVFNYLSLTEFRKWDRDKELTKCAIQEILTIFALPVFLSPLIGYLPVLILLVYAITWFVLFNRWVWRTVLRPQV